jgi:hypothetical protein
VKQRNFYVDFLAKRFRRPEGSKESFSLIFGLLEDKQVLQSLFGQFHSINMQSDVEKRREDACALLKLTRNNDRRLSMNFARRAFEVRCVFASLSLCNAVLRLGRATPKTGWLQRFVGMGQTDLTPVAPRYVLRLNHHILKISRTL